MQITGSTLPLSNLDIGMDQTAKIPTRADFIIVIPRQESSRNLKTNDTMSI